MAKKGKKKIIKRAPKASYTKGFYRFTREFPSVRDSEGFRSNESFVASRVSAAKAKKRLLALCALVFSAAFIVTGFAFAVSKQPIPAEESPTGSENAAAERSMTAAFLTGDALDTLTVGTLTGQLRVAGVDTVIIEFKDASGHFYYSPGFTVAQEAVSLASQDAAACVSELKSAGFTVMASVSLLADDIYARNNREHSAYIIEQSVTGGEERRSLWYDSDSSRAWLSPFSDEVSYYLSQVLASVAETGVDAILLANAAIPSSAEASGAVFPGSDGTRTANLAAAELIEYLVSSTDCAFGASFSLSELISYSQAGALPQEYSQSYAFLLIDSRASAAGENVLIGNKQFNIPTMVAGEFAADLYSEAARLLSLAQYSSVIISTVDEQSLSECTISLKEPASDGVAVAYRYSLEE